MHMEKRRFCSNINRNE